jgi:hypothetical protein
MNPMYGTKPPMEDFVSRRNALERGLATVRKVRRSSQQIRGKLSFISQDSTWKVSQPTGQMLELLIRTYNSHEN